MTHLAIAQYNLKNKPPIKIWPLWSLKQIYKRRYVNRRSAIQLVLLNRKSLFFNFDKINDMQQFIKNLIKLKDKQAPNLNIYSKKLQSKKIYQALNIYQKWNNKQISNIQYLSMINYLSGRSYNDLTQYPVMPWILNYSSSQLQLNNKQQNSQNFRDLSVPMGCCGSQQRKQGFIQRYQNMLQLQDQRFHYGTHYSSPAIIYHFLVRIQPFTTGNILLQSGKLDIPDRLFFSVQDSYKNAITQYSDVRQLITQMYSIPQVYLNCNFIDLGIMQNGRRVWNVQLPQWSKSNPYLYICKLRKAFQSNTVNKKINKWIDLIYGYKQKGQQAVKNINLFVNLTYQDSINYNQITNQKQIQSKQTQILNFGQTPSQLFTKPHGQRAVLNNNRLGMCDQQTQVKIYRTKFDNKTNEFQFIQNNLLYQQGKSIIYIKWVTDNRLIIIHRNGIIRYYKWHGPQPGVQRVPFQCAMQKQKVIKKLQQSLIKKQNNNTKQNVQIITQQIDKLLNIQSNYPVIYLTNNIVILGGYLQGKILVVDIQKNLILQTYCYNNFNLQFHKQTVCCLFVDKKQNFVISGDVSGKVIMWKINKSFITNIANNKQKLISTNNNSKKSLLSLFKSLNNHKKKINQIIINQDLSILGTSSQDGYIYLYNLVTCKMIRFFKHRNNQPINSFIISTSPIPCIIMFVNKQQSIYSYSINGQLLQRIYQKQSYSQNKNNKNKTVNFTSSSIIKSQQNLQYLVYSYDNGNMYIRRLPYLQKHSIHVIAKQSIVNCLGVRDSKLVIGGCSDGQMSVIIVP